LGQGIPSEKDYYLNKTIARGKVYKPSEGNTKLSKLKDNIYLSSFQVTKSNTYQHYTLGLHGENDLPPAGVYTVRITRYYNGTEFPIGTHPYDGFKRDTTKVDYDWKLNIPSPRYDQSVSSPYGAPIIWSSVQDSNGDWETSFRSVTNSDYNKSIPSLLYQNTQIAWVNGEKQYNGSWYKQIDTTVQSTTKKLNTFQGNLLPNSPNPVSIIPFWVGFDDLVQGEGTKTTDAPPSNGDGFKIVITDYEP
jgi:hypothetical protein